MQWAVVPRAQGGPGEVTHDLHPSATLCVCRSLMATQMLWQFNEFVLQSMDQLVAQLNTMEPTLDYNARCVCMRMCVHARVCVCVHVGELCRHCLMLPLYALPLPKEEHG